MNQSSSGADGLFAYLQKQREAQRIAAEIEALESDNVVRQSLKIKHELEALMADYELSPKELIETACLMFGFESYLVHGKSDAGTAKESHSADQGSDAVPGASPIGSGAKASNASVAEANTEELEGVDGVSESGGYAPPPRSDQAPKKSTGSPKKAASERPKRKSGQRPAKTSLSSASASGSAGVNHKSETKTKSGARVVRRGRKAMVYENPHTGQKVVTKGANHRTLNEWREQYGEDVVASWGRPQQPDS